MSDNSDSSGDHVTAVETPSNAPSLTPSLLLGMSVCPTSASFQSTYPPPFAFPNPFASNEY